MRPMFWCPKGRYRSDKRPPAITDSRHPRQRGCRNISVLAALAIGVAAACSSPTSPGGDSRTFAFDFATGPQGWVAGFADYPQGMQEMNLVADYRPLSSPLDQTKSALYISGQNNSSDLFMFYKRQITGLTAGGDYQVSFTVQIASREPYGCFGAGGSPGESVYVKTGASAQEPAPILVGDRYEMNISKGRQSTGGSNAVTVGNIANSIPCQLVPGEGVLLQWQLKELASPPAAIRLRVSADGSAWLFVGTDSGFLGTTSLYYTKLSATFESVL
jgi:hypothetical protein